MKKPKLKNLKKNSKETNAIRTRLAKNKAIKITINIDSDSLTKIKNLSNETGVSYQRLLNNLLKESLKNETTVGNRIDKIEKEIKKLKKLLAA